MGAHSDIRVTCSNVEPAGVPVCDIVHLRSFRIGTVLAWGFVGVIPAFIVMMVCFALYEAAKTIILPLGLLGVVGVLVGLAMHRARVERKEEIRGAFVDSSTPSEVMASMMSMLREHEWMRSSSFDATVAEAIWEGGARGIIVRAVTKRELWNIDPIANWFEAAELDEASPGFDVLAGVEREADDADEVSGAMGDRVVPRRMMRNVRMAGGWVSFVIPGLFFVRELVECVQTRQATVMLAVFGLLSLLTIFGGRFSTLYPEQWLVVPGGILLRRPARGRESWMIARLVRDECVLFARQTDGQSWIVYVSDGQETHEEHVTEEEVKVLLRAWTSPHEPPALERLSDLAG